MNSSVQPEDSYDDPFKMIRNNFNFTFICEFLYHFSSAFFNGADDILPTTPYMEHLLLYQDDAKKLNQFYIKLLKPLPGWRMVSPENWFESLAKEYKKRDLTVDFPVPSTMSTILTIPLLQRLEILRRLCEFHLEQPEHFWELLRVKDGESDWRIEPIGRDSTNRRYWLFADGRLYREKEAVIVPKGRSTKKRTSNEMNWDIEDEGNWELICLSRSDYDEFMETLSKSGGKDKQFLKMIKEEIIPIVEPILHFQLAQHRKYFRPVAAEKQICLLPRKRSTRLVLKEIEEEQRRLERDEAEKEAEKERQTMRRSLISDNLLMQGLELDEEKDLSVEREMRAEMRRIKKEKELQIKEIEEAFYSTYKTETESNGPDDESDVEIVSENEENSKPFLVVSNVPSSPIKLVLKFSKPSVKEEVVDVVGEMVIDQHTEADILEPVHMGSDPLDIVPLDTIDSDPFVPVESEPIVVEDHDEILYTDLHMIDTQN